jgi:hypothetical protein
VGESLHLVLEAGSGDLVGGEKVGHAYKLHEK